MLLFSLILNTFGGKLESNFSSSVTHIVTGLPALNGVLKALKKKNPQLLILKKDWLVETIANQAVASVESHVLNE